jgi:hypothetical protein
MSLLWIGMCRIYFNAYSEAPLFWSVDRGDTVTAMKCPRVVMAGNFEAVVAPEQNEEPFAWLFFRKASVYRHRDGVVVVTDLAEADRVAACSSETASNID